jgi:dipeptidyl aminopeptidase/acylaminoacyl peptidase
LKGFPAQWSAYWSPDNQKITYTDSNTTSEPGEEREWNWDIYVMDSDGSNIVNLSSHAATDIDSHWSPDGARLCFASNRAGNFELYTIAADGTDLQRLTDTARDEFVPRWSPDGSRIVFASPAELGNDLFLMDLEGGPTANLTDHPGNDSDPWWSPDGRKIVFTSNRDGNQEIYAIHVDGSSSTRLTFDPSSEANPAYSNDGRYVAFGSLRDGLGPERYGYEQIYIMHADGSKPHRVTLAPTGGSSQASFSADDERLLFSSWREGNQGVYVIGRHGSDEVRLTPNPHSEFFEVVMSEGADVGLELLERSRQVSPDARFTTDGETEALGAQLLSRDRVEEAARVLELLRSWSPSNTAAQDMLRRAYLRLGRDTPPASGEILTLLRWDAASGVEVFRNLLTRYPGWYLVRPEELLALATSLVDRRAVGDAAMVLEAALEKHPRDSSLRTKLASAYLATGQRELAIDELERVLALDDEYQEARELLDRIQKN